MPPSPDDTIDARAFCFGMMEIALGLLFLLGSLENSRAAYWAAGIWALTGGVILISGALLLRRRLRDQEGVPAPRQA